MRCAPRLLAIASGERRRATVGAGCYRSGRATGVSRSMAVVPQIAQGSGCSGQTQQRLLERVLGGVEVLAPPDQLAA